MSLELGSSNAMENCSRSKTSRKSSRQPLCPNGRPQDAATSNAAIESARVDRTKLTNRDGGYGRAVDGGKNVLHLFPREPYNLDRWHSEKTAERLKVERSGCPLRPSGHDTGFAIPTAKSSSKLLLLQWERHDEKDVSPNQIHPDIGAMRRLLKLAPRAS